MARRKGFRHTPETKQKIKRRMTKHGGAVQKPGKPRRDYLYVAWENIVQRCTNPRATRYESYGGRAIELHPAWRDHSVFRAYVLSELGHRPSPGHTLDRIDNDLGYVPSNLRWATRHEQSRNTRSNVWIDMPGGRMCLKDACALVGRKLSTASMRIAKGWDPYTAVITPPLRRGRTV